MINDCHFIHICHWIRYELFWKALEWYFRGMRVIVCVRVEKRLNISYVVGDLILSRWLIEQSHDEGGKRESTPDICFRERNCWDTKNCMRFGRSGRMMRWRMPEGFITRSVQTGGLWSSGVALHFAGLPLCSSSSIRPQNVSRREKQPRNVMGLNT